MKKITLVGASLAIAVVAGCATMASNGTRERALDLMNTSFKEKGQAKLDRLAQDDAAQLCSRTSEQGPLPAQAAKRLQDAQFAAIKYPADGNLIGNWENGERIAQTGTGFQYSDDPTKPAGANCYACHQIQKKEISFGTIGPSLAQYGKLRGFTPEMTKYTYGKIYNAQAFAACSNMPRFGHKGILSEQQIKDVVALLMDPKSPVNQ